MGWNTNPPVILLSWHGLSLCSTVSLTGSLNDVAREPDSIGWIGDYLVASATETLPAAGRLRSG